MKETTTTPKPVIQRDPAIKFMCLSEWFQTCLTPSYLNYTSVGDLHTNYTNWVSGSPTWTSESLVTLPVFSKHLAVLLHANNWKYARVKKDGIRGYYGIVLGEPGLSDPPR